MFDVLREGASRRLIWGADSSGRYRARDYFEELDVGEQAKFEPLFDRLAETGKISNRERFVKEPNGIYCFKSHARRIACFFDMRDVVLIHGFGKKATSSKRSRRQLATAARLRVQYLEENPKGV
jgi:Phage derived protein Gp49-like (DUF891)